jgi:hypothetical protein
LTWARPESLPWVPRRMSPSASIACPAALAWTIRASASTRNTPAASSSSVSARASPADQCH